MVAVVVMVVMVYETKNMRFRRKLLSRILERLYIGDSLCHHNWHREVVYRTRLHYTLPRLDSMWNTKEKYRVPVNTHIDQSCCRY